MAISSGSKGAHHRKVACKCEGRISLDLRRDPCRCERSEAIQPIRVVRSGLLRGACHPAALRADRLARNDRRSYGPVCHALTISLISAVTGSRIAD
jgi:hypothetical protein